MLKQTAKGKIPMKKIVLTLCIGFFAAITAVCSVQKTDAAVKNGVVRLHVRANSNTAADQALKLKVRDRILDDASYIFKKCTDTNDAKKEIEKNIELIAACAENEIQKNGYNYPVSVKFGKSDFPEKVYKNITMPAGTYEALIVEIGSGKGENWWCVLFPPLCFVDETCSEISDTSKNILIDNLGKDAYETIQSDKKVNVKIKFKIYELWEKGAKKLKTMTAEKSKSR